MFSLSFSGHAPPPSPPPLLQYSSSKDARQRLMHRRYTDMATAIQWNLRNLSEEDQINVFHEALIKSDSYRLLSTKLKAKPRGISRVLDETINLVWTFWCDNATLSNAKTDRPSSMTTKAFENHPLLQRVDISKTNISKTVNKRKIENYTHQDMVQNDTDTEIFNKFKLQFPTVNIGKTTFKKIKPFFIRPCKPADLQTCCCKNHVNFRNAIEALIEVTKQYNSAYEGVHPNNDINNSTVEDCERDEFGLLLDKCESGECGSWNARFQEIRNYVQTANLKNTKGFIRFEYDAQSKLQMMDDQISATEIVGYIENKLTKFVEHSNTVKQDYLFWKKWMSEIDLSVNAVLVVDFSENLSLPIHREPQSMYWVRKQISLHCGVGFFQQGGDMQKKYFGHMSDDRQHDQPYTALSVDNALTVLPASNTLFLRSDNASNFKSAEAFHDVQMIANKWGINIVRIYGAAGHGKGEVDSCGGILKKPVRKHISKGNNLRSANAVVNFLTNKYDGEKYVNPVYHLQEISVQDLKTEREKRLYMRYDTIKTSDSWHVIIFRPKKDFFYASSRLCICDDCMQLEFEKCPNFQMYVPSVGKLSKPHLRSAPSPVEIAARDVSIVQNTVFAIRADNDFTNFFLIMCDVGEEIHSDPMKPLEDDFGHKIYDGTAYVTGRYLEYESMNNKCHVYKVAKSKVFVAVESIFFPYIPILATTKSNIKIFNEIILELQVKSSL